MMRRRWQGFAFCLALAAAGAVSAGSASPPGTAAAVPAPAEAPSPAARLFAAAPVFNGALGEQNIQVSLRRKDDMREGLEGEYFIFGGSNKILLAGEFERDGTIFLEESEDGRSVSGQWDGKLDGMTFSGTWSSSDGSLSRPFRLKIIPVKARGAAPSGGRAN